MLSAFGRFNERGGGGGVVHFRPVQRAGGGGGGGAVHFRPIQRAGGGGLLSAACKKKKSQYRLTVAVSEKFSARLKTKGSSHTIGKKYIF